MIPKRRVVFLDMDHTLINGHSQKLFMRFLLSKGLLPKRLCIKIALQYFLYSMGFERNFASLRQDAFSMLKGISAEKMERLYDEFFLKVISPLIRPKMLNIINFHKQRDDTLVLITASMREIAERVKYSLGLDHVIATRLEIENGLYTGRILDGPVYAGTKAILAKRFLDIKFFEGSEMFAYSDHISDLALLFMADHPVCVKPSRALRQIAQKLHWTII